MILLQNEQSTLPFAFRSNVDCINCDYAQKQHWSHRKSLFAYCFKGMAEKKKSLLKGIQETYVHQCHKTGTNSYLKAHFGNAAWKLVGKTTAEGNAPGSDWNFCLVVM